MPNDILAPRELTDLVCKVELGLDEGDPLVGAERARGQAAPGVDSELIARLTGDIAELGRPRKWDLTDAVRDARGVECPTGAFWLVEIASSFLPAEGHRFSWCRLVVRLSSDPAPELLDLYPREVNESVKQTTEVTIGGDLKFRSTQIGTAKRVVKVVFQRLEPRILAVFGADRRTPTWNFHSTEVSELRGVRPVYLAVHLPEPATALTLEFALFARIRFGGRLFPLSRKKVLSGTETFVLR